jgi:hypothetical protein
MYKIDLINKKSRLIQEGNHPEFGYSFLEYEKRITVENEIGNIYFFQETLPGCDSKYWINNNGIIVEMSDLEKSIIDSKLALEQKIKDSEWAYPDRPIRITITQELCLTGGDYAAYANDFKLLRKPYEIVGTNESFRAYLQEVPVSVGFSLHDGIISSTDSRLLVEQLDNNFTNENGIIRSI